MMMVTKRFHFAYGHSLPGYVGPCIRQHGHNAELEVSLTGPGANRGAPSGMICDFSEIKKVVNEQVIQYLDHQNINEMEYQNVGGITEFTEMVNMPTAENMMLWIVSALRSHFNYNLEEVRLSETPDSWVVWRR